MAHYELGVLQPELLRWPDGDRAAAFEQAWNRVPIRNGAWRGKGLVEIDGRRLFVKGLRIPLIRRRSRWRQRWCIHNEFRHLVQLQQAGIDVPQPVAWGSESTWGVPRRSFLVTRWIADAPNLHTWLRDKTADGGRLQGRDREVLTSVGRLVYRLHECGFAHGDLSARNLLVHDTNDDARTVLVDPARARLQRGRRDIRIDQLRLAKTSMKAGLCREDAVLLMDEVSGGRGQMLIATMTRLRAIRSRNLRKLRYRIWFRTGR